MDIVLIATGFVIGLAVAAPVGPVNLMCIQNTVQHGLWSGFAIGIGAAAGDGVFAVIAAFGITWISSLIEGHSLWIQGIGGAVLIAMGLRTMFLPPAETVREPNPPDWLHHGGLVGTTFLVTITNPATFAGFVFVFSGIKSFVAAPGDYAAAAVLVLSVVAGSFFWWMSISWVASRLRRRFTPKGLSLTNRISGVVIAVFGVLVLADLAGLRLVDRFV